MTDEAVLGSSPAGFWRRLLAGLFDIGLLLTVALTLLVELVAAVALAAYYGWVSLDATEEQVLLWIAFGMPWCLTACFLLPILYFTLCEGAFGQTLGKRLFGLVVVSAEGQPIGYGRAFARLLTLPYSWLPIGLGFLWAAVPPAKRTWHDYISATRVIASA